ncbi:alkaline phosphatase [Xylariomycetidae sp. FL2044]|nr:alkaline phosphatase [Xylariomycetidae sp. FL2044]
MHVLPIPVLGGSLLHLAAASASASAEWQLAGVKNVIYIVPDGFGPASQTMARDYASLVREGGNASAPASAPLAADTMVLGSVRTQSSDNLITDSAASATAFACGVKTYNDAVGVDADGAPVASILEAAKLSGYKTGMVVTSTINHATPACYASHVRDRNSYEAIAAQEIGYAHPFGGPFVDILLGGGRCYFKPQSDATSCRTDDVDLLAYAAEHGYRVMLDRPAFDELEKGLGEAATLPYIGLFNDDQMLYEIDRSFIPDQEPSLLEMVETALNTLDRATTEGENEKGYFLLIEASRIDHAGHANDAAAHLHDVLMYNSVLDFVRAWIDARPDSSNNSSGDTLMLSAADHECGGLTLNGFDPLPLRDVFRSLERLESMWAAYLQAGGPDPRAYLTNTILPDYGLAPDDDDDDGFFLSDAEIDGILARGDLAADLPPLLSARAGVDWSTGGHTAADVTLYGYVAAGPGKSRLLRADLAGSHDNTELPRYLARVLGVSLEEATTVLRANGTDGWVGKRGVGVGVGVGRLDHVHRH